MWHLNGGVYFGVPSDRSEGAPPAANTEPVTYIGDRHILTVGPNGSGKSRRLLLPNLVQLTSWSICVIDPKGELAAMTAKHRAKNGNHIVLLNPFDVLKLGTTSFNPVAALDPTSDDFPDDALGMAESLIRVEGNEPHWSQAAQEIVAGLIMYSRLTQPDGGSLGHVRWLLGLPVEMMRKEADKAMQAAVDHDCEELVVKLGRLVDASPDNKELSGILSTALTQTRWLDSRPMKKNLEGSNTIDFATMKDRPVTVYLILPARRLGTHSTWLRLMIASLLQSVMKDTRKAKVPVLLMLDEFAQLGHLPVVEQNMAMMRGYGVKLWAVYQDLAQAEAIYGKRWESFIANSGVLQTFAPQDVVTAEYLSKLTGQTTKTLLNTSITNTRSPGGPPSRTESAAFSQTPMPLMLPQDLRNMDQGFAVLFTHLTKGPVRTFLDDPSRIPRFAPIAALSP
jgi:type IV secretion system protein VirD4